MSSFRMRFLAGTGALAASLGLAAATPLAAAAPPVVDDDPRLTLAQRGTAGALDRTFNAPRGLRITPAGGDAGGNAVDVGRNGSIVAAGSGGPGGQGALVRYRSNGRLDRAFSRLGIAKLGSPTGFIEFSGVDVLPGGRTIASGSLIGDASGIVVARHRPNGQLDRRFGFPFGWVFHPIADPTEFVLSTAQAVQPDGKILVVGNYVATAESKLFVARLNSNGTLDPTFGPLRRGYVLTDFGAAVATAEDVALQANGRIVVTGSSTQVADQSPSELLIARFTPSGLPDPTFDGDGSTTVQIGSNAAGGAVEVQRDGKILVGGTGNFVDEDGWVVARFLQSGVRDLTFGRLGITEIPLDFPQGGVGQVQGLAVQRSGRIALGGFFGPELAVSSLYVARLRANGAIDRGFGRSSGYTKITPGSFSQGGSLALTPRDDLILTGQVNVGGVFSFVTAKFLGRARRA